MTLDWFRFVTFMLGMLASYASEGRSAWGTLFIVLGFVALACVAQSAHERYRDGSRDRPRLR